MVGQAGDLGSSNASVSPSKMYLDSGKNVCTVDFFGCKGTPNDNHVCGDVSFSRKSESIHAGSKWVGPCQPDMLEGALQAVLHDGPVPGSETLSVGHGCVRLNLMLEKIPKFPLKLRPSPLLG
jgi:hypothetical protein